MKLVLQTRKEFLDLTKDQIACDRLNGINARGEMNLFDL
jgi:hypothetical protein